VCSDVECSCTARTLRRGHRLDHGVLGHHVLGCRIDRRRVRGDWVSAVLNGDVQADENLIHKSSLAGLNRRLGFLAGNRSHLVPSSRTTQSSLAEIVLALERGRVLDVDTSLMTEVEQFLLTTVVAPLSLRCARRSRVHGTSRVARSAGQPARSTGIFRDRLTKSRPQRKARRQRLTLPRSRWATPKPERLARGQHHHRGGAVHPKPGTAAFRVGFRTFRARGANLASG